MSEMRAALVRTVLESGPLLADALIDQCGLSEKQGEALLNNLCREGALRRSAQDRITIMDRKRCERYVAEAQPPPPAETTKPPVLSMAAPKPVRQELPIPASIAVRKDVPLPPSATGARARPCPWPFDSLVDIGDSFAVDVAEGFTAKRYASAIKAAADAYTKKHPGFRVAVRTALDGSWVGAWREAAPVKPENVAPITDGMTSRSLGIRARKAAAK